MKLTISAINLPWHDNAFLIEFDQCRDKWLWDCGDLHNLSLSDMVRVNTVFITHTHIDHFCGIDAWVRSHLLDDTTLHVYGPPELATQLAHKLQGYAWDKDGYNSLIIIVYELGPRTVKRVKLECNKGFVSETWDEKPHNNVLQFANGCRVRFAQGVHRPGIPCLAYLIEEPDEVHFNAEDATARGLTPGPWVAELSERLNSNNIKGFINIDDNEYAVETLLKSYFTVTPGRRFAYITDSNYSEESLASLQTLGSGIDELWGEACFFDQTDLAAEMGHFTVEQTSFLANYLNARKLYLIHVSRRYQGWKLYQRHITKAREQFKASFRPPMYRSAENEVIIDDTAVTTNDATVTANDATVMTNDATVMTNDATVMTNDATVMTNDATGRESFGFSWVGKREALAAASTPATGKLAPIPTVSIDDANSNNIFIEGDNLEALKLLQDEYSGRIKMIYIDPPYNTKHNYVYKDSYTMNSSVWRNKSGIIAAIDHRSAAQAELSARSHSAWCSMMFPRLILAKQLLRDDGIIFISCDDVENANLRQLCTEVFGENNFLGQFVWQTKRVARGVPPRTMVVSNNEYVLVFARNITKARLRGEQRDANAFKNSDNDPRGLWRSESIRATGKQRNKFTIIDPATGMGFYGNWAFSRESIEAMIANNLIIFPKSPQGTPRQKKFINSYLNDTKAITMSLGWHSTERATKEFMELFDNRKVFDFSKPLSLMEFLVQQATESDDIVLDFFAGSATTAHATMKCNVDDSGQRRFIMVQCPEPCATKSEAYKAGYATISDIGQDRIRRAASQLKRQEPSRTEGLDFGFQLFTIK